MKKNKIEIYKNAVLMNGVDLGDCYVDVNVNTNDCAEIIIHCFPAEIVYKNINKPVEDN